MPVTISIPKKIRQYSLDRLLTEVQAITDDSQSEKIVITFPSAETIPCSLVFRATHKDLGLDVAMRAIPVTKQGHATTMSRTVRAVVQQMWEVREDHVVNLIDYGEEQGGMDDEKVPLYFFVSEYLKGRQKITDVLSASEDLTEHIGLLNQALQALEYAHRRDIVHGRLHPGNLLVEVRNGQLFLRVTDFGHHTIDQMNVLSDQYEPYIHPSYVIQGSEQADLYSLGSVFYQLLTEEAPSHRIKPMIATLRRRYRASYPQVVQALEAAWSLEATAAELLSILNLPKRESLPSFHLTATLQKDNQYYLRAACELNGESSSTMDVSSLVALIPHACKALEEEQSLPPSLGELPKMLHDLLLPPRLAVHLGVARERAQQRRERRRWGLPFLLDFSAAEELADWPWELMCDESNFLGLEPHVPLLRVMDSAHADGDRHLTRPLSLLIVSSQPKGLEELNVKNEVSKLKRALRWMGRYHYQYDWVPSGSWDRVQAALIEKKPNVVHFIGHGTVNPANGMGELIFCDSDGYPDPVSAKELGLLFKDHGIELLFLNACSSARVSDDRPGAAVAISLLKQGIPNVLAMQYSLEDEAAILLTETFYKELALDKSFAEALVRARMALYSKWRDKLIWATPVMYVS